MDMINYIQIIQMILFLALLFISFYWHMPLVKYIHTVPHLVRCPLVITPAYEDAELLFKRSDIYVYDKYQIWRYVLRKRTYSIDS